MKAQSKFRGMKNMEKDFRSWLGPLSRSEIEQRFSQWKKSIKDMSWQRSASPLLERMRSMQMLLKRKDYPNPDDFFFSIEDLPYMGKEYWFLYFVVPGKDDQVIITAGRSQEPVTVNQSKVKENDSARAGKGSAKIVDCAAVCWMYSGHKEVFIDSSGQVGLENKENQHHLFFRKGKNEMTIQGAFPEYDIRLKKGEKTVFSVNATAKKTGDSWEMPRVLENPFAQGIGAVMVNYFFDFKGKLDGKSVNGKAYLQKVVATIPLAPWNWIRIEFENGDSLDYFVGKPLGDGKVPKMSFLCNDYIEIRGKRFKFHDLLLESFLDGEKKRWVLSGKNIFLSMESYSLQPFSMRQKTQFQYDEYLVRVTDFILKLDGKTYTLKEMGPASGIIEDAYGYLL